MPPLDGFASATHHGYPPRLLNAATQRGYPPRLPNTATQHGYSTRLLNAATHHGYPPRLPTTATHHGYPTRLLNTATNIGHSTWQLRMDAHNGNFLLKVLRPITSAMCHRGGGEIMEVGIFDLLWWCAEVRYFETTTAHS